MNELILVLNDTKTAGNILSVLIVKLQEQTKNNPYLVRFVQFVGIFQSILV